jgi:chromosome segregation ATPase
MGFLPVVAIALVVVTVAASLYTGQSLGEVRKNVFQLEMQAEELRRRVNDLEQDTQKSRGHVRTLTRLRSQKRENLADLYDELKEMQVGGREITVAAGLQQRGFEVTEAA